MLSVHWMTGTRACMLKLGNIGGSWRHPSLERERDRERERACSHMYMYTHTHTHTHTHTYMNGGRKGGIGRKHRWGRREKEAGGGRETGQKEERRSNADLEEDGETGKGRGGG